MNLHEKKRTDKITREKWMVYEEKWWKSWFIYEWNKYWAYSETSGYTGATCPRYYKKTKFKIKRKGEIMTKRIVYPIIISKEKDGLYVSIPDFEMVILSWKNP